jgi:hypothetical protein
MSPMAGRIQVMKVTLLGNGLVRKHCRKNSMRISYLSTDGVEMVEFHVANHDFLHDDLEEEMGSYGLLGGNLS